MSYRGESVRVKTDSGKSACLVRCRSLTDALDAAGAREVAALAMWEFVSVFPFYEIVCVPTVPGLCRESAGDNRQHPLTHPITGSLLRDGLEFIRVRMNRDALDGATIVRSVVNPMPDRDSNHRVA